jgi:leucine dehydrogenase
MAPPNRAIPSVNAKAIPGGKVICLEPTNPEDLEFVRSAYGYEAEERGWFRERDRLFVFSGVLTEIQARRKLRGEPPPSLLDVPPPALPDGPVTRTFLTMDDGTKVRWIRHPSGLSRSSQAHWRHHTALFAIEGTYPHFVAYTSILSFAVLDGADGKFRFFAPGGIRWTDYPNKAAAISDAMDMSLAVGMKIQVVKTPSGGNKISVYGDKRHKGAVLRSIFAAYERMGFIVTSADLGLSLKDLEEHALPVAPTTLVPMGVFQKGIPSALVTADAAFAGLQAMAASLPRSPSLDTLTVSLQGCGEVGYRVAQHLVECGARLKIAEPRDETCQAFQQEHPKAFASGQVTFLQDPDGIYDEPADIFCPCALRDILTKKNLGRLLRAGVRIIGGPANNLFPDQTRGPWMFHDAGLPVVPYEGIGAGGVTGVAYSIMTGVFGRCPFQVSEKIEMIRDYVAKVLRWSGRYDLPAQVISDRILFRSALRRRLLGHDHSVQLLELIRRAMNGPDRRREQDFVNEYTKKGFFYGEGRSGEGG